MTQEKEHESPEQWPAGWDEPWIANLLQFASLTPEERPAWLDDMLELMEAVRQTRENKPGMAPLPLPS
jgi:hypothetical protein